MLITSKNKKISFIPFIIVLLLAWLVYEHALRYVWYYHKNSKENFYLLANAVQSNAIYEGVNLGIIGSIGVGKATLFDGDIIDGLFTGFFLYSHGANRLIFFVNENQLIACLLILQEPNSEFNENIQQLGLGVHWLFGGV